MGDLNNIDTDREARTNLPEVVFASGKDDESLVGAVEELLAGGKALVTKCDTGQTEMLLERFSGNDVVSDPTVGIVSIRDPDRRRHTIGMVAVLAAGSSDYPVAEEATISAQFFDLDVMRFYDCGVAGLHRIKAPLEEINKGEMDAVIVVAGMEGTLPSVISGLVRQPVIAVPTSVGYGTGMGGTAALMTMLNSCSPGIAVMNIDNGFGAAAFAYKLIKWMRR